MLRYLAQYLEQEDMYYLVSMHEEDGITGEWYFETKEEYLLEVKHLGVNVKEYDIKKL